MYARLTITQTALDKTDQAIEIWRDKVGTALKQQKGFKGAYLIGDHKTGKGMSITLWETEADVEATNVALPQFLALFDGMFTDQPTTETYEVLVQV